MTATIGEPINNSERPKTRIAPVPPYVGLVDYRFLSQRPAERVEEVTPEMMQEAKAMAMALKHFYTKGFTNGRRGFAIAHPQVNTRPYAFFVAFDVEALERLEAHEIVEIKPYFNPEIVEFGGRKRGKDEMCLSFPFHSKSRVERYEKVKARWQDENMEWHEQWFEGKFAQVWQHEMEHLLGGTIYGAPKW